MIFRRVTTERLGRALGERSNRRIYAFSWRRVSVLIEGKSIPNEFVRAEDLFR